MSPMIIAMVLLLVCAMGLCLLALRSPRAAGDDIAQHRHAQRNFYRQRQRELQDDLAMGLINAAQRDELSEELDKQLLEENAEFEAKQDRRRAPLLWLLVLLLPALAVPLYDRLGYRLDYQLLEAQQQLWSAERPSQQDLQNFESLVQKILSRRPDNAELLMTMASIRRKQGDYAAAADYYQRLQTLFPQDADVLAQLAQARYLAANRQIDETTRSLLERALAVNPQQATALGVLGIDAFAAGNYPEAVEYWQRLQVSLEPSSGEAMVIASGLNEAKRLAIEAGDMKGLAIELSLDPALGELSPGVLFVVAREPSGSPMPVAALRIPLGDSPEVFPLTVYLTNSDVIRTGVSLDDFPALRLSAHISGAGVAVRRQGDWVAPAQVIDTAEAQQVTRLLLDRRHGQQP